MASRLFISRDTLWRLERGEHAVAIGTLATALFVLQSHDRLADLAAPASDARVLQLDEKRASGWRLTSWFPRATETFA